MITKAEVRIRLDGSEQTISVEPEKETILQAALDQDIDLPFSCMGGACSTCKAQLIEGEVEMDCNLILSDEEVGYGYVLACQARPLTEKVFLNFDDQE